VLGIVALALSGAAPLPSSSKITGDYVETRTASVFAGACHFNGEYVTTGREAIMAWQINSGSWNGVDLTGLRAMASITASANLGDEHAVRKFELIVDPSATTAQVAAFTNLLQTRSAAELGTLVSTRCVPVMFTYDSNHAYTVRSDGFASLSVQPMPNNECCTQPQLVWYTPLVSVEHRKVGYTRSATYAAGTNGERWTTADENSSFYGSLAF
jgi:hypothetical protein